MAMIAMAKIANAMMALLRYHKFLSIILCSLVILFMVIHFLLIQHVLQFPFPLHFVNYKIYSDQIDWFSGLYNLDVLV